MRGEHLFARGDIEGALTHFRRASQLSPEDDDIQQAIGNALAASGDLEGAKATYAGIVQRSCYAGAQPTVIYERLARLDDALTLQKAIACDAAYAHIPNLASVLFRQGRAEQAMEAIRSALRPGRMTRAEHPPEMRSTAACRRE
jgi:Flp pilus assembly protein TadD